MKFFVDTAMVDEIRQALDLGICDGVTTNPSLVAMTGKPLATVVSEITEIIDGPISVEATAMDYDGMLKEAREIAAVHPNIVVKIPMTREGIKTVSKVSAEGIKTNVTLIFSANQALLAAKAGATYVSPFVGRVDDISGVGMELIEQIQMIYGNYDFGTEVLVASIRHPIHVLEAAQMGADVATIPFGVMDKLFNHPLTDIGIEKFLADWEKVPK
jgi:transaldolase